MMLTMPIHLRLINRFILFVDNSDSEDSRIPIFGTWMKILSKVVGKVTEIFSYPILGVVIFYLKDYPSDR